MDQKTLAYQQMMTVLSEESIAQMRTINPDFDVFVKKAEEQAQPALPREPVEALPPISAVGPPVEHVAGSARGQDTSSTKSSTDPAARAKVSSVPLFFVANSEPYNDN